MQGRLNGFFDLKELQTAILEENGRISFLAKSEHRPVSPSDLNLSPHKERLLPTYIMDGKILYENLLHSGKDEEWLRKQLSAHGCKRLSDIFLATGNQQNTLNVYFKNNRRGKCYQRVTSFPSVELFSGILKGMHLLAGRLVT